MFDFRIGVNSGEMVVAAYGSRRLGTLSVAGEPVEFARRLCRANLIYGSRILARHQHLSISPNPPSKCARWNSSSATTTAAARKSTNCSPCATCSPSRISSAATFSGKASSITASSSGTKRSALFHSARSSSGADGPVEFYIRRIEQLRGGTPALDWTTARL